MVNTWVEHLPVFGSEGDGSTGVVLSPVPYNSGPEVVEKRLLGDERGV